MKKLWIIPILIICLLLGCFVTANIMKDPPEHTPAVQKELIYKFKETFALPRSSEKQGVPESLIYEYLLQNYSNPYGYAIQSLTIQDCVHEIDLKTHRDSIIVTSELQYNYLSSFNTDSIVFQYDKSSDTWTLLEKLSSSQNISQSPKSELIGTLWQGTCQPPFRKLTQYTIYVDDVDYIEGTIICTYYLSNEDFKKSGNADVNHIFEIDDFYTIYFDYNEGLTIGF